MKRIVQLGLGWIALWAVAHAAEENFSRTVRPADFAAAGLAKLTPDELARLDGLVRDYKSGVLVAAKREAEAAEKARVAAEAKAAKAAADAQSAREAADARVAKAEAATAEKKNEGGLLAKARALLPAGTQVEYAAVESRIAGNFTGWQGRTVFTLENGQRWQVANSDASYVTPPVASPAVKITPSSLGGYWMTIEGVNQRVRVVAFGVGR